MIRGTEYEASDVVPGPGSNVRHPLTVFPSLHRVPAGPVPRLHQYYEGATTSCRPSRRTSFPSLGGTSVPLVTFAPRQTSGPPRPGVGHPVSPPGNVAEETTGSPKFLGNPKCPFAHVQSTPAGLLTPDHYGVAAWPLVCEKQRLPREVFRRSIAWLSDWLSTLRSTGYPAPRKTRFQLLVRLYWTGFPPAGSLRKVSKLLPYISSPFPKLGLAQSHRPPHETAAW